MVAALAVTIVLLICITGATIWRVIHSIESERAVPEHLQARCFPSLEGVMSLSVKSDPWPNKTCSSHCTRDDKGDDCFCYIDVRLDKREGVLFKLVDPTQKSESYFSLLKYTRSRDDNVKNLHVFTNNGEVVNEMTFNADLISLNHICEIHVRNTTSKITRCTTITVQKVKERYLKLRSCAKRDWMGIWDLDDLPRKQW